MVPGSRWRSMNWAQYVGSMEKILVQEEKVCVTLLMWFVSVVDERGGVRKVSHLKQSIVDYNHSTSMCLSLYFHLCYLITWFDKLLIFKCFDNCSTFNFLDDSWPSCPKIAGSSPSQQIVCLLTKLTHVPLKVSSTSSCFMFDSPSSVSGCGPMLVTGQRMTAAPP